MHATAYICAQVSFDRLERGKDGKPFAPGLKRLRRFEKAMGPGAEVRTEHRRSWEAVEPVLPEFMQAHVARFLEIGRISNIADSHRRVFLAELARVLSQSEWFVLSRMLVRGTSGRLALRIPVPRFVVLVPADIR